jgi:hypothetical protein
MGSAYLNPSLLTTTENSGKNIKQLPEDSEKIEKSK